MTWQLLGMYWESTPSETSIAGGGSSVVAADILWSDPVAEPGMQANDTRGVGLTFGPDVTQVKVNLGNWDGSTARLLFELTCID